MKQKISIYQRRFLVMNVIFVFPDYLLFFVCLLNLMLSIFIFVNNPKNKINLWFAVFSFFMSLWPATLLMYRNVTIFYAHFWMRLSYISAIGIGLSFWYFVHFFPSEKKLNFFNSTLLLIATLAIISFFTFDQNFVSKEVVELANGGRTVIVDKFGYMLFSLYFSFFFFGAIVLLWLRYKKMAGLLKRHAKLLLYSVALAGTFGVFFNLILPSPFLQNFSYIHLGPFFTFFIILTVAYGVARYQLMNIKALVVEIFVVLLIFIQFLKVIISNQGEMVPNLILLGFVLAVGFLLIRSVLSEVKRREEMAEMASSLEKANIRLKELDQQKTEFLSIASHQLRTPLAVLKGYAELVMDGAYGKPTAGIKKVMGDMDQSNEHLVKLIDEFLDISRIEQGRTKYNFVGTDMAKIVGGIVSELQGKAREKKLKLIWLADGVKGKICVDEEKVRHVIFNFVDNSIKYSGKGTIEVKLSSEKNGISVKVFDQGIGFGKIDEASFFQKFYRGENVKRENVTGTGLGLYVCRKFIEAHGGRIWAKSKGLGKGSEFGFWIPNKRKHEALGVNPQNLSVSCGVGQ